MTEAAVMMFPNNLSLELCHNEHKNYYDTVAHAIAEGWDDWGEYSWVSPEQRQKAIDTDECWSLQWYPITPIGFYLLRAADLDVLLAVARAVND